MFFQLFPRRIIAFLSLLMVVTGVALGAWAFSQLPTPNQNSLEIAADGAIAPTTVSSSVQRLIAAEPTQDPATPTATAQLAAPIVIGMSEDLPLSLSKVIAGIVLTRTDIFTAPTTAVSVTLRLETDDSGGTPIYRAVYVPATRFDVIHPAIDSESIRTLWRGDPIAEDASYAQIAVVSDTLPSLTTLLGPAGLAISGYKNIDDVTNAVWADRKVLALLPFDALIPELAVLAVDGQNPIDNSRKFSVNSYPFILTIYAQSVDQEKPYQAILEEISAQSGSSNRREDQLTVLAMTGVTAMTRMTAQQMELYGAAWPAQIVGPELTDADITVVSNEVPFVEECVINVDPNNFNFCSAPEYMAALEAVGVDIVGLTGNHQNDFGRENSLKTLEIYAQAGLPVYGGGKNKAEAMAPLYFEHNGNRLAFLGANSYGPPIAWATDGQPGSAPFDLNIMSATIRNIKEQDLADVILAELQYQETYGVEPLIDQRMNFGALIRAGADIVTGIQSHVPQAIEFEGGRLILHGLGNFFFDQMVGTTREGLVVKHTIYDGRHISTQVLTTLIYDYGQPHWATESEREMILGRVFNASYWERPR
jgi:poly-gamma-glutamate synthesis protein (capsule biosynthesis protein)